MFRQTLICTWLLMLLVIPERSWGGGYDGSAEHLKKTRRPIPILSGLGTVDFSIQCRDPRTQHYFNQGIAFVVADENQLADWSFAEAVRQESECAMAWFGLAIANADNRPLAAFYIDRALELQEKVSERERQWLQCLKDYFDAGSSEIDRRSYLVVSLDRLMTRFPNDHEATTFLVRQLIENREVGIPIPLLAATDLMIDRVLLKNPKHPIHFLKVRLWDEIDPQRALSSAGEICNHFSSSLKMQIAAGQIYARLEQGEQAIRCLKAAHQAAISRMDREKLHPSDIDGYVDLQSLLIEQLANAGRIREATALARGLIEIPFPESLSEPVTEPVAANRSMSHSRTSTIRTTSAIKKPVQTGQRQLLDLLVRHRRWDDLFRHSAGKYFESTDPAIQSVHRRALALAFIDQQKPEAALQQVESLQRLQEKLPSFPGGSHMNLSLQINTSIREIQGLLRSASSQSELLETQPASPRLFNDGIADRECGIGPWQPSIAPPFDLPDQNGQRITLQPIRGRGILLVFYLGAGCPHCIEQLQSLSPLKDEISRSGLMVVAVSTDSVAGLQKTLQVSGAKDAIPFRVVSDEGLQVFREYGAFDARDQEPLHGAFLIDQKGRIVWRQVRREPFMAIRALLNEAERTFGISPMENDSTAARTSVRSIPDATSTREEGKADGER